MSHTLAGRRLSKIESTVLHLKEIHVGFENIEDVQKFIRDEEVEFIDVRFTDVPGIEHHFSIPRLHVQ